MRGKSQHSENRVGSINKKGKQWLQMIHPRTLLHCVIRERVGL